MDIEKVERYIEKVELFHGLTPEEVVKIFSKGMTMKCAKGETLFFKGTVGSQMYVVLGGKIGILEGQQCIATMTTGDMFGEMALVNKEPRSATAVALEDSHLFLLSESTFEYLMNKRVAIRILLNIIHSLSNRLKMTNAKLMH
ncbi:MAG TPA: cyclic nucleotide-binding domain-containing protein [Candidatus Hydrogenedentes bacterium]|nr:cyclic nucleotide-binding domain-containing protein [Candidatus Hydrogenedentota bacterium]